MNRKEYSKAYNQSKQALRDAIKRLEEQNPERFKELEERAKHELNEPPKPRIITRHRISTAHFDVDEFIRRNHKQDYFIHTIDCWNDEHLYFESLDNETAEEVLTRRHSKFIERSEKVTKIEKCECPLCQQNTKQKINLLTETEFPHLIDAGKQDATATKNS